MKFVELTLVSGEKVAFNAEYITAITQMERGDIESAFCAILIDGLKYEVLHTKEAILNCIDGSLWIVPLIETNGKELTKKED